MSWSKIKKAINSRLGQNDFKPLDKIITDGFDDIKSGLEGGVIVPKNSKNLDGAPKSNFRGNGTGFSYDYVTNYNVDYLTTEGHYFLVNSTSAPEEHGFLDVDYYSGEGFDPDNKGQATHCIKQTFRTYEKNTAFVRNGKRYNQSDSFSWSDWVELNETLFGEWVSLGNVTPEISLDFSLEDGVYCCRWSDSPNGRIYTGILSVPNGVISWNSIDPFYNFGYIYIDGIGLHSVSKSEDMTFEFRNIYDFELKRII